MSAPDRVQAPFLRRSVTVNRSERHGAYVVLRCEDPDGPRPQAGQFYMLTAAERWGGGESERPFLPRAFSVMRAPERTAQLEFLLEDVGPGTKRLCELGPGDELLILGPLGVGFKPPRDDRAALLVGGGVGIAPLAILQEQLAGQPRALLGFRDRNHAAGAELLRAPRLATDDGSAGHHGLVTELMESELDSGARFEVYACGPQPMLDAVHAICTARSVPVQLALESGMACGYGACFGCVVPTRNGFLRVCVDGPVLDGALL